MTQEQRKQFDDYGCISRALRVLAARCQQEMTEEEFCRRFENLFLPNNYGAILTSSIADVLRDLQIGRGFITCRRYEEIDELWNKQGARGILVMSEINLDSGASDVFRHCSLLEDIDSEKFVLLRSYFPRAAWNAKECHAVVPVPYLREGSAP